MCAGPGTPYRTALYTTRDGGRSWQAAPAVPKEGIGGTKASGLYFRDPLHGVALFVYGAGGGGMLVTADGGQTWTAPRGLPGYAVLGVSFAPADGAYATVLVPDGGTALFGTSDGGATWQRVAPPPTVPYAGGLAAADGVVYGVGVQPNDPLLRSTDGGRTWTATAPNAPLYMATPDGRVLFAIAPGIPDRPERSDDGGHTWVDLPLPTYGDVRSVAFVTPDTGYVATQSDTLYRTDDGGHSFQPAGRTPAPFDAMDFTAPATGWALDAGGHLHHTADDAATWSAVALPGLPPLRLLAFCDGDHGMAVAFDDSAANGTAGVGDALLLSTSDGGRHWSARPLPGVRPSGLALIDARRAILATDHGPLLTSDGGATWHYAAPALVLS